MSTVPVASFSITGDNKQYKRLRLTENSITVTNADLQAKYPIQFGHDLTRFELVPMTDDGDTDLVRSYAVQGKGKEVMDDKIVFKGKQIQDIRFDKEGWYNVRYKVYNGIKESDWASRNIYIASELPIAVDGISMDSNIVIEN